MFVQRMMTDPEFARRVHAQQAEEAAKTAVGGDPLAYDASVVGATQQQRFLDEANEATNDEAPPPISKEEARALDYVDGREDAVKVVAQSLAFVGVGEGARRASTLAATSDPPTLARDLAALLRRAYGGEEAGPEAFRDGALVDDDTVEAMLADPACRWLTVEAANGRGVEADGAVLGAACASSTGLRCELRFLAVEPAYRGLYVGHRLLERLERDAVRGGARQLVACVPSPSAGARTWCARRGYRALSSAPFPAGLPFAVARADARLVVYAKELAPAETPAPAPRAADDAGYDDMD